MERSTDKQVKERRKYLIKRGGWIILWPQSITYVFVHIQYVYHTAASAETIYALQSFLGPKRMYLYGFLYWNSGTADKSHDFHYFNK